MTQQTRVSEADSQRSCTVEQWPEKVGSKENRGRLKTECCDFKKQRYCFLKCFGFM